MMPDIIRSQKPKLRELGAIIKQLIPSYIGKSSNETKHTNAQTEKAWRTDDTT